MISSGCIMACGARTTHNSAWTPRHHPCVLSGAVGAAHELCPHEGGTAWLPHHPATLRCFLPCLADRASVRLAGMVRSPGPAES